MDGLAFYFHWNTPDTAMSTLNDTDLFVIERSGTQYQVRSDEMSTLNDTDLFVVERAGVQYKVEAVDVVVDPITGEFETPVEVLTPLNGAGIGAGVPYNPISSPITVVGVGGTVEYETSEIVSVEDSSLGLEITSDGNFTNDYSWDYVFTGPPNVAGNTLGANGSAYIYEATAILTLDNVTSGDFEFLARSAGGGSGAVANQDIRLKNSSNAVVGTPLNIWPGGGAGAIWQTITANDVTTIEVRGQDPGLIITGIRINGVDVKEAGPTLTFTDDTNFDKFQVGDVVQNGDVYSDYGSGTLVPDANWNNWVNVFKTQSTGDFGGANSGISGTTGDIVWEYPDGLPVSSSAVIWYTNAGTAQLFVTGADGVEKEVTTTSTNSNNSTDVASLVGNSIHKIRWQTNENLFYFYSLFIDGTQIIDGTNPDVKVVSIDDSGPYTITVDGGEWTTSDKLVKETSYEASLTCSDNTELANMVGPISMTDENGDLVTPQTSEITSVGEASSSTKGVLVSSILSGTDNISSELTNAGITEIRGIGIYRPDAVSTALYNFSVDGTDQRDLLTGVVDHGTAFAPIGGWSGTGYVQTDDVNADQNGFYWFTFDPIDVVGKTVVFSTSMYSDAAKTIIILTQNNEWWTLSGTDRTPPSLGTLLTFADNTDLEYFSPGDVVQGPSWNQSQTWSANVNNGATPVNAYDGNLDTFDYGSSYTNTFTTPITVSKLRVYADGPQDSVQVYLDGAAVNVPWSGSVTKQWWDVPISGSAVFSQVTITHSSAALYAVEADGKILVDAGIAASGAVKVVSVDPDNNQMVVDGGEWKTSSQQVWSSFVTPANAINPTYPATNLFDGDTGLGYATGCTATTGNTITWQPTLPITGVNTLEIGTYGNEVFSVNGSTVAAPGSAGAEVSIDKSTFFPDGVLTSIQWAYTTSSSYMYLTYIKVNGEALTDKTGSSSVTGNTLEASATGVIGVDGNTLQIDGVSGSWRPNLRIKGASISSSAPSPSSIVFTSSNGGTTAVTGTDATLTSRVWTLNSSSGDQNGPWNSDSVYTDLGDVINTQDGATPWTLAPPLQPNTYYKVKVQYTSDNADPVESVFNTFKTGDA